MNNQKNDNSLIMTLNMAGVFFAYALLGISLWLSTEVPLATKGYWAMGIVLLTLSLVNVVKYRFDQRGAEDRIRRIEDAKNEKILEEFVSDEKRLSLHKDMPHKDMPPARIS